MAIDTEQKRRFVADVYAPPPDGSIGSLVDRRHIAGEFPYDAAGEPPPDPPPQTPGKRRRRRLGFLIKTGRIH